MISSSKLIYLKQTLVFILIFLSFFSFSLFTALDTTDPQEVPKKIEKRDTIETFEKPRTQSNTFPRYGLYSCNWDGTNFTRIFGSDEVFITGGRVSPNGSKIVLQTCRDVTGDGKVDKYDMTGLEIAMMDINGENFHNLTYDNYIDAAPNWAPNGSKILWSTTRFSGDKGDIAVMNLDGSNAVQLTTHEEHEADPAWVNDKVVYARNYSIWMMYENGSNQKQLTDFENRGDPHPNSTDWKYGDYDPDLSPDETMITFERLQNDTDPLEYDIFVANISNEWDVTGEKDLSKNNWSDAIPEFSPDGKKIIFWTGGIPFGVPNWQENIGEMFVINTTGENRTRIDIDYNPPHIYFDLIFIKENPDWFPSATWEINGIPDVIFSGKFYGEWVPPVFVDGRPEDITLSSCPIGYNITWDVMDADPDNYTIEINGGNYKTSDWDGDPIVMKLDNFGRGFYEINITVFDQANYNITDSVNVNITYCVWGDDDDDNDDDDEPPPAIEGYNIILIIGSSVVLNIIIIKKKLSIKHKLSKSKLDRRDREIEAEQI
ncbi:MAG: TolB family protein [Candidatus Hodarchaeota archaeon]